MKNTFLITCLLFAVTCMQAQQIAFPGAEGYGKWTVGGRGGRIVGKAVSAMQWSKPVLV